MMTSPSGDRSMAAIRNPGILQLLEELYAADHYEVASENSDLVPCMLYFLDICVVEGTLETK